MFYVFFYWRIPIDLHFFTLWVRYLQTQLLSINGFFNVEANLLCQDIEEYVLESQFI